MGSKRVFLDRTKQFNNRSIKRVFDNWGNGLIIDYENPQKSFSILRNANDYKTEVRGRAGTLLYNFADAGVTIPLDTTFQTALDTILSDVIGNGKVFMVYGFEDFSDTQALKKAKNKRNFEDIDYKVYPYDIFEITNSSPDPENDIYYHGSLLCPSIFPYVPVEFTNEGNTEEKLFKVQKDGKLITVLDDSLMPFEIPQQDMFIVYGRKEGENVYYGQRDYLIGGSYGTFESNNSQYNGIYDYCMLQYPIWASHYHQVKEKVVILVGDKVYYLDIPFRGFKRIHIIDNHISIPIRAESRFHSVEQDVLLTNENGLYRITFPVEDEPYGWKTNTVVNPNRLIPIPKKIFGFEDTPSGGDDDENPFVSAGFSGIGIDGKSDKTGGLCINGK